MIGRASLLGGLVALGSVAAVHAYVGRGGPRQPVAAGLYLSARYRWASVVGAQAQGDRSRIDAEVVAVTRECPDVLKDPPRNHAGSAIAEEMLLALIRTSKDAVVVDASHRFVDELSRIAWEAEASRRAARA